MKKTLVFVLCIFISICSPIFAANHWHEAKIKSILVLGQGDFILQFDVDHQSCLNTSSSKNYYVRYSNNYELTGSLARARFFDLAKSAAANNNTVIVRFNDERPTCDIDRFKVKY